jgi:type IV secretory pathway TrbF-like protein
MMLNIGQRVISAPGLSWLPIQRRGIVISVNHGGVVVLLDHPCSRSGNNFVQIAILLIAWLIVVISFFIMAIQLFVSLIEFKLTTLAGFVLVPFGLLGRTAFLAEKVLGNVVSSGVKVLVLAAIVGIGSTIFGQFTNGFNNPPTISDAPTLILAALALLGLTIFSPGIANALIAGGPQLGAGAAVGTGMAVAGIGAAGGALAVGGVGAAGGMIAGTDRSGAAVAGGAAAAYRAGGMAGVAGAGASAAMSPLRRAADSLKDSFAAGGRAVTGGSSPTRANQAEAGTPPAWARRMERNQTITRGASAADQAIRPGDRPSGGSGVDLSEGELSMFRRPTVRYGMTPEPETPYQRAGQVWDERIGSARVQAKNWRFAFFVALALSGGLAGAIVWQSVRGTVTPWVVQIDRLGQAQAVAPAVTDYRPTDPQIAWHLARFIEEVRGIPADPVVLRQNWLEAYSYVTDKGALALNDYARTNNPFSKIGKAQVAVDVSSVIRASEDSFRVEWVERHYVDDALAATERWSAFSPSSCRCRPTPSD